MRTVDLKAEVKYLYGPSAKKVEVVDVPRLQFARIDGAIEEGAEPGTSPGFAEAVQALYSIAYTLKFTFKKRFDDPVDFPVMALEGLWWTEDGDFDITIPPPFKDNWRYTLMILEPDVVSTEAFAEGVAEVRKKRGESAALARLRLETFTEGLSMQMMHVGPYATEPETMQRMAAYAQEHRYVDRVGEGGKHHEIYLGDPRKADLAKLKTILRHPIRIP